MNLKGNLSPLVWYVTVIFFRYGTRQIVSWFYRPLCRPVQALWLLFQKITIALRAKEQLSRSCINFMTGFISKHVFVSAGYKACHTRVSHVCVCIFLREKWRNRQIIPIPWPPSLFLILDPCSENVLIFILLIKKEIPNFDEKYLRVWYTNMQWAYMYE